MIRRFAVAAVVLFATVAPARADEGTGYVDEIAAFGGVDIDLARELVVGALSRAGLRARFAAATVAPCGDQPACLAERGRAAGARVAIRLTVAEVGDDVVASILIVQTRRGEAARHLEQGFELGGLEDRLAALLGSGPARRAPRRRIAAWSLVGATVLVGVAGAAATWMARDLRDDFFTDHVDANGDVVGLSPAAARAAEARARGWALAGGLLIAGAGATGLAATVLFVDGGGGGEARPAGVAVTGRF
jgi:hypothetical protein